jgi:LPS-assembly lipoprotein
MTGRGRQRVDRGLARRVRRRVRYGLVSLVVAAPLVGCGFRLAGGPGAGDLDGVWVSPAPSDSAIARRLVRRVETAGGERAASAAVARWTIRLSDESFRRRSLTVTPEARTAEYELTGAVTFSVRGGDGSVLLADRRIEARAIYRRERDNLLASAEEQALLTREIQRELAARVLRAVGRTLDQRPDGAG